MALILELFAAAGCVGVGYALGYIKALRDGRKLTSRTRTMLLSPRPIDFKRRR